MIRDRKTSDLISAVPSYWTQMDATRLAHLIESGVPPLVLDVRSAREFDAGHIRGARHRPFQLTVAGLPKVDRDQPIVVYCGHGPRAQFAAWMLRLHGFTQVACLTGHMAEW